jgi:hypothetical protein
MAFSNEVQENVIPTGIGIAGFCPISRTGSKPLSL